MIQLSKSSSSFLSHRAWAIAILACLSGTFLLATSGAQTVPAYSKVIIFGDSLSDVGNVRKKFEDKFFVSYPGGTFNYSDGRFTNSSDTDPASTMFVGVWHEQLARTFLNLAPARASLDGGSNYAFGGATTEDGTRDITVFDNPAPFSGGSNTITVDNMGRQIDRYLNEQVIDPAALYVVWGGGNDFFQNESPANVIATSQRVVALVNRLVTAGAKNILVPNVPPLGAIPFYANDGNKQAALNRASADYRRQLNSDLDAYVVPAGITPAPTISRLDIWALFVRFVANPARYNFTDMWHAAKGMSSVNPDKYIFWDDIHPTTAGHFEIAKEANRLLSGAIQPTARALNLATRANVLTGDNVVIGGFIVTGPAPKRVVVRGLGPSLTGRGIPGALADPAIELRADGNVTVATNDNWRETQAVEIAATGLAPQDDREAAIVQTLDPGNYTVVLRGTSASTGVGLVEIYDVDAAANSTLANVSTRGTVGTGDDVLIGGVIVGNGDEAITIVRALGPSLTGAGVAGALADPTLELYDSNGVQIRANDDWRTDQESAFEATQLDPTNDREAAIAASLAPGNYTAVVRGKGGSTGVALVEVYRIP